MNYLSQLILCNVLTV